MKNIFVGSIAVYASLVLASSALPALQQQIILSINGHTTDSDGSGLQTFDVNSGLLTDPKLALGQLDDQELFGSGGGSAVAGASASAGQGHVSVSVFGQATTGGPTAPVQGGAIGSGAGGEAQAYYQDYLHFSNVGAPGATFVIFGLWNLSGTVTSSAVTSGAPPDPPGPYVVNAQGGASLKVFGSGLADFYLSNPEIARDSTVIESSGTPVHVHTDPPPVLLTSIVGQAGSSVLLEFGFDATAGGNVSSADLATHQGGLVGGNVDFSHTAGWGGITKVTDGNGNIITGWTVTSDSGFDYTQPYSVPEPSAFALLAIALPSLLLASRRYRRNQIVT